MLREFNHINPQDDEEGKIFTDTRVSDLLSVSQYIKDMKHILSNIIKLGRLKFRLNLFVSFAPIIEEFATFECRCMLSKIGRMQKVH